MRTSACTMPRAKNYIQPKKGHCTCYSQTILPSYIVSSMRPGIAAFLPATIPFFRAQKGWRKNALRKSAFREWRSSCWSLFRLLPFHSRGFFRVVIETRERCIKRYGAVSTLDMFSRKVCVCVWLSYVAHIILVQCSWQLFSRCVVC